MLKIGDMMNDLKRLKNYLTYKGIYCINDTKFITVIIDNTLKNKNLIKEFDSTLTIIESKSFLEMRDNNDNR